MTDMPQTNTIDLADIRLQLRSDVTIEPRTDHKAPWCLVSDTVRGKYYRVGVAEGDFLLRMDGKTTVREAVGQSAQTTLGNALDDREATTICRWAIDQQLAVSAMPNNNRAMSTANAGDDDHDKSSWLFYRMPLFNPERVLRRCNWLCHWMTGRLFLTAWLGMFLTAMVTVLNHWPDLISQSTHVFAGGQWLVLGLIAVVLKLIHECFHAAVCQRYGVQVPVCGIMWMVFAPLPYVDTTAAWRLPSKWQRMYITSAGVYAELFVASLAIVVWGTSTDLVARQVALQTVAIAGIATILFNANPLMRFDGYYLLSDWLEVPNLQTRGRQALRAKINRILFGKHERSGATSPMWLAMFGLCSMVWWGIVGASIAVTAITWWHGAGLLITLAVLAAWVLVPIWYSCRRLSQQLQQVTMLSYRAIVLLGSVTCVLGATCYIPWPFTRSAPAVAAFPPSATLRTQSAGFVKDVRVNGSESVQKNQLLAVLENRELQAEIAELQTQLAKAQLLHDTARRAGDLVAVDDHQEQITTLRLRLDERLQQQEFLKIRSPIDGEVQDLELDMLLGTYQQKGSAVLTVANPCDLEVRVSIAQQDAEAFIDHIGKTVLVGRPSRITDAMSGTLTTVNPQGSDRLTTPALAATAGGPLPVKEVSGHDETHERSNLRWTESRIDARIQLSAEDASMLRAGQLLMVTLPQTDESIAQHVLSTVYRWIERNILHRAGAIRDIR